MVEHSEHRALSEDLHWLAVGLARGLATEQEAAVRERGIGLRAFVVLSAIAASPGSTQLAIAGASRTDKSMLVGVLDELERDGLITRTPDPADRRARLLNATDRGAEVLGAATAAVVAIEDRVLGGVDPGDREAFRRVLSQLVAGPLARAADGAAPANC